MRRMKLLLVLLFVLPSLAMCQQKSWSSKPSIGWSKLHRDKTAKGKYEPDYIDKVGKSDNETYELTAYRNNRAIDTSRPTDPNGSSSKSNRHFSAKSWTNSSEERQRKLKVKNVTIAEGICQSIDIRNNVYNFAILENCRVIEGFLQIVLIESTTEADFQNVSFPGLREITGYLLLYRVYGLKTLGNLFPNLEAIRGDILLTDYAFMVYEMQNLQEIGLRKLTEITRGGARIEKNPSLCYTKLNWSAIVTGGESFVKDNNNESSCPGCSQCPDSFCWTAQHCQMTEKPKCHHQCLGECYGPTERDCYVCKHYRHEGKCVKSCPSHLYAYISRRCITKAECLKMNTLRKISKIEDHQKWRPFNRSCITQCPEGYEDHVDENKMISCRVCKDRCRKIGKSAIIRHISDAQVFRGTTVVNGALEFQIRNGYPNIMQELTEAFGLIEEITEYVKITHSFPITSLGFFKKLKVIKGEKLDINNASLVVLDNPNLSNLFPPSQKIDIQNGRLFFHYNPKLCMSKIVQLGKMVGITNFSDLEVQPESNGEKVACNIVNINITVKDKGSSYVNLIWDSYKPPKGQQLLSYLLNYIETENENISYEVNACGNNTWQIVDVDIPNGNLLIPRTVSKHISGLKPYTKYAIYVKTFTTRNESFTNDISSPVGQSEIIFFRTKSDIPSKPTDVVSISQSDTEILVSWKPPERPNGPIGYYMISGLLMPDDAEFLSYRDYCKYGLVAETEVEPVQEVTVKAPPIVAPSSCCSKDESVKPPTSKKFEVICDQNLAIGHVYTGWNNHCVLNRPNSWNMSSGYKSENMIAHEKTTFVYNVSARNNSFRFKNLRHFSLYTISVAACGVKLRDDEQMCSSMEYTTARTKRRENADNIENVKIGITNNSIVEVSWDTVKDPNALTVSYTIEYTNLDVKDAKKSTECIPYVGRAEERKSHDIRNLSPGHYSLRLRSTSLAGDGSFTSTIYFSVGLSNDNLIMLISLLIFGFFTAFIIAGYIYLRNRQKKKQQERLIASVNPDYIETQYVIDTWEVPRESVEILEELGLGNFGMVYRGRLDNTVDVAIKTISETASGREKNEFLNEASVMKNFSTFHIIKLLGVVSIGNPPFVIMELMENGDLKTYLRRIRDTHFVPNASRIIRMAAEIADGMAYLESKKFVHRDLAARNCMVSKDLVCKIGDFGMARDIYETDYYKIGKKGLLPIRWMAPENLSDGVFTSDSDVWSFGVVLYEILTLAEIPYQGFSNEEVLNYVLHKGILGTPRNCPENIQKIMEKCFKWRPNDRPTFMEIVTELEPFLGQDFCENSFYHSDEGVEIRSLGIKKVYHHAAPIRFHWGNETARWVREFEDNVTLLDQTKAGTSRGRIFKNGFQHFGNVTNVEEVLLDR